MRELTGREYYESRGLQLLPIASFSSTTSSWAGPPPWRPSSASGRSRSTRSARSYGCLRRPYSGIGRTCCCCRKSQRPSRRLPSVGICGCRRSESTWSLHASRTGFSLTRSWSWSPNLSDISRACVEAVSRSGRLGQSLIFLTEIINCIAPGGRDFGMVGPPNARLCRVRVFWNGVTYFSGAGNGAGDGFRGERAALPVGAAPDSRLTVLLRLRIGKRSCCRKATSGGYRDGA
jgi:hypothetical protein